MIRPLRRRHRWMVTLLGVIGPAIMAAALTHRASPATTDLSALEPPAPENDGGRTVHLARWYPGSDLDVVIRIPRDTTRPLTVGARRRHSRAPAGGAWHLYWQAASLDTLASDATLLGPLQGELWVRYPLPPAARTVDGFLMLYSAGHGRVIGGAPLPTASIQGASR